MDTRLRHGLWMITSIMCGYVWLYFIHLRPCSWADPRSEGPGPHDKRGALLSAAPAAAYLPAEEG